MNTADTTPQKFTIWSINKRFYLLAIPIACTYFLMIASRTIDTVFSSKFDVNTLAAIPIAFMIAGMPLTLITGILYAAVPQYSFLKEKKQYDQILNIFVEFLIIAVVLGTSICLLCMYLTPSLLEVMHIAPPLIPQIETYLKFLLPFILGMIIYNHLYFFSESYGFPVFATLTVLISLLVQGMTIYALVFSNWFADSWGIAGFVLASVFLVWTKIAILLFILLKHQAFKQVWQNSAQRLTLSVKRMCKNTVLGLPIGLDFLSEWAVILLMSLSIASLGVNEAGSNGIIHNILTMLMIVFIGFGRASSILVAQFQDHRSRVKKIIYIVLTNFLLFFAVMCLLLVFFSHTVISFYQPNSELIPLLHQLFLPMILVCFFMGLNNVLTFMLRGLSQFFVVFIILFICLWLVFLPLGYLLSSTNHILAAQGAIGWWHALAFAYMISCLVMALRLYSVEKKLPEQPLAEIIAGEKAC